MVECWISLRTVIHGAAFIFFTLQMVFAVQKYMAKPTMVSPETRQFSSLKKPLQITVCKVDQFNHTHAAKLAYSLQNHFLAGEITNQTVLSWTGHTNRTFEETMYFLYNSTEDIVFTAGYSDPINGTISSKFLVPLGLCKVFVGKPPATFMSIKLATTEMSPHMMFISDPTATKSFQLPYSLMSGLQITLKPPAYANYNVQIRETKVYTDDGSCVDYPNPHHESYSDCVDAEMRDWIMPTLGCMLPWMSTRDACTKPIQRLLKHEPLVKWIFNMVINSYGGIEYESESCPQSCTLLSAHSAMTLSGYPMFQYSLIFLYFKKDIQVEKIVLAYDSTALLVEIGSCLGLWLGLSIVGIFDLMVLAARKTKGQLKAKISGKNKNRKPINKQRCG